MDLIPRAEHRVRRMRLSMKLAHLVRGGNFLLLLFFASEHALVGDMQGTC